MKRRIILERLKKLQNKFTWTKNGEKFKVLFILNEGFNDTRRHLVIESINMNVLALHHIYSRIDDDKKLQIRNELGTRDQVGKIYY